MYNELSLQNSDSIEMLQTNNADRRVGGIKVIGEIASLLPPSIMSIGIAGPLIAEVINQFIPNQKIDRLVRFAHVLDQKLGYIGEGQARLKLEVEGMGELLEEVLHQASKATSEERRIYLASLLENSLTDEDLELVEKEKLLQLLGQINDAEVLHLVYYHLLYYDVPAFEEAHAKVLGLNPSGEFLSQVQLEKDALITAYQGKLVELGLIRKTPTGYSTTALGILLLRYLNLFRYSQDYQFELQKRSKK